MSRRIYKYPLRISGEQDVEMPEGAELLSVGGQGGELVLWAQVDPDARLVRRKVILYGTGHELRDEPHRYVGTVQFGIFVWHVYDGGRARGPAVR